MSEIQVKVPDGMLRAAREGAAPWSGWPADYEGKKGGHETHILMISAAVEGALRWLAENPIRPTSNQIEAMIYSGFSAEEANKMLVDIFGRNIEQRALICMEWQRRMFIAPEPGVCTSCHYCPAQLRGDEEMREHLKRWHSESILMLESTANGRDAYLREQKAGAK